MANLNRAFSMVTVFVNSDLVNSDLACDVCVMHKPDAALEHMHMMGELSLPLCLESSEAWQSICYLSFLLLSLMTASNSICGFYHSPAVKPNSCVVFPISHQTIVWELDLTFINPKDLSICLVFLNCIQLSKFSKIDGAQFHTIHFFVRSP